MHKGKSMKHRVTTKIRKKKNSFEGYLRFSCYVSLLEFTNGFYHGIRCENRFFNVNCMFGASVFLYGAHFD